MNPWKVRLLLASAASLPSRWPAIGGADAGRMDDGAARWGAAPPTWLKRSSSPFPGLEGTVRPALTVSKADIGFIGGRRDRIVAAASGVKQSRHAYATFWWSWAGRPPAHHLRTGRWPCRCPRPPVSPSLPPLGCISRVHLHRVPPTPKPEHRCSGPCAAIGASPHCAKARHGPCHPLPAQGAVSDSPSTAPVHRQQRSRPDQTCCAVAALRRTRAPRAESPTPPTEGR